MLISPHHYCCLQRRGLLVLCSFYCFYYCIKSIKHVTWEWSVQSCLYFSIQTARSLDNTRTIHMIHMIRAVRYDDIYQMDEIKSPSFHIMFYYLFVVLQNTLFVVIPFHDLSDCDLYTPPPRDVKERQNIQPGQNQELVPKRGLHL